MLFRIAAFASLAGFLYGYDEGLIGGAALAFARDLHLSDAAVGAAVGAAKLGAVAGAAAGGACMQSHGRVPALRWVAAAFVVGPLIMALARGLGALVVGRLVVGLGIGGAAVVVPAYLGEVAPARSRGRVVESFEVALAAGMLAAVMVDAALSGGGSGGSGGSGGRTGGPEEEGGGRGGPHWRVMVGLPMLPAFILAAGSFLLPESPRWLVVRGRLDEALAVIHRVLTNEKVASVSAASEPLSSSPPPPLLTTTAEVERELLDLWSAVEKERAVLAEETEEEERRRRQGSGAQASTTAAAATLLGGAALSSSSSLAANASWQQLELAAVPTNSPPAPAPAAPAPPLPAAVASRPSLPPAVSHPGYAEFEDEFADGLPPDDDDNEERDKSASAAVAAAAAAAAASSSDDDGKGGQKQRRDDTALDASAFREISQVSPPGLPKIRTRPEEGGGGGGAGAGAGGGKPPLPPLPPLPLFPLARTLPPLPTRPGGDSPGSSSSSPSPGSPAAAARAQRRRERAAKAAAAAGGSSGEYPTGLSVPPPPLDDPSAAARAARKERRAPAPVAHLGFWGQLSRTLVDVRAVAVGPERRAFWLLIAVAAANQGMASSAVVTFAPALLRRAGVASDALATALSGAVSGAKLLGVAAALLLVDAAGRRPLATWGGAACSLSLALLAVADSLRPPKPALLLAAASAFITAFSASHAGLFWVLASELFSMRAKPAAATAATASLFASGAVVNLFFLPMHSKLGGGVTFSYFAVIAVSIALLCWLELPETKGRTLAEVVEVMQSRGGRGGKAGDGGAAAAASPPAVSPPLPHGKKKWWPPRRLPLLRGQRYSRFGGGGGEL